MSHLERTILESAVEAEIAVSAGRWPVRETNRAENKWDRGCQIFGLPDEQLLLIATGEAIACSDEMLARQYQRPYFPDGPCLVYSHDRKRNLTVGLSYFGDGGEDISSTPGKMKRLAEGMYLVDFTQGILKALSGRNLAELLRQYSSDEAILGKARKLELPGSSYDFLATVSEFEGRCGICGCLDADCHSDFCWKENGRVMLYFGWTAGWITDVTLYPEFVRGPEREYP